MAEARFSITIPSHGRPAALRRAVESFRGQSFPRNRFEIIVVDDGSPTPVEPFLDDLKAELPLRVIRQRRQGPAAARNLGLRSASSEYIAFTDDDCCPHADWLAALNEAFTQYPQCAAGGLTTNALPANRYAAASQLLIDYLYGYYGARPGGPAFFTSNNLAFPAEDLRRIGGFDNMFRLAAGEDRELCERWRRNGGELIYAPRAIVLHAHDLHLASFWRQHFRYGRAAVRFHGMRRAQGGTPRRLEPFPFYSGLIAHPFTAKMPRPLSLACLLSLAQFANAAGYFSEIIGRAIGNVAPGEINTR
jgi:GT2 family glycosyltransferase